MDPLSVLEAARAPLSIEEIKEYSGSLFEENRIDALIRSGEIAEIKGAPGVYWSVPPALRKRSNQSRKVFSPASSKQRESDTKKIIELRNKINTISAEFDALKQRNLDLPTEKETQMHIERLHKLNETRDEGVKLVEKLAAVDGTSVHSIYERFDIDENMLK